jgi:hypothetical protein
MVNLCFGVFFLLILAPRYESITKCGGLNCQLERDFNGCPDQELLTLKGQKKKPKKQNKKKQKKCSS